MNASPDIVERLRERIWQDHKRLCTGREYSCTCGFDDAGDRLFDEAADEITRLRAQLAPNAERLPSPSIYPPTQEYIGSRYGVPSADWP